MVMVTTSMTLSTRKYFNHFHYGLTDYEKSRVFNFAVRGKLLFEFETALSEPESSVPFKQLAVWHKTGQDSVVVFRKRLRDDS